MKLCFTLDAFSNDQLLSTSAAFFNLSFSHVIRRDQVEILLFYASMMLA